MKKLYILLQVNIFEGNTEDQNAAFIELTILQILQDSDFALLCIQVKRTFHFKICFNACNSKASSINDVTVIRGRGSRLL